MSDYTIRTEEELRALGYDPRGRGYVAAMQKSPWRGKLNYDKILDRLFVGSLPVFDDDARQIAALGVSGVVDMCRDNEHEDALLAEYKIAHYPEFVPDTKAPSQDQLDRLTAWIDSYLKDGKKVYIHCHAGRGRAPTIACAYLITQGYAPMEAFDYLYKRRISTSIQVSRVQHEALAKFHARQKKNQEK
jgi:rhodanese-related sulfurtransferase